MERSVGQLLEPPIGRAQHKRHGSAAGRIGAMLCILMYTFYLGTEGGRAKGCGISTGNLGELVATPPNGREYDATIILYLRSISRPQCAMRERRGADIYLKNINWHLK